MGGARARGLGSQRGPGGQRGLGGRRQRRGPAGAVQEALFDVRPRPERRFYRQMLDALARSDFGAHAFEAELAVSKLFGAVWAGQEGSRDGSTEEAFGLGLVEFAREYRRPAAVALLRTLVEVAPIREVREAAWVGAEELVTAGLPQPPWRPAVGAVVPDLCWAYEDVFGDHASVVCGFHDPFGEHSLMIQVDHASFSAATSVVLLDDAEPLLREFGNRAQAKEHIVALRQVEQGWARALLERAFARTDLIDEVVVDRDFADLRALTLARIRSLAPGYLPPERPPPTPEQCDDVLNQFLASPEAAVLPDRERTAAVARMILAYGGEHDPGNVIRVGPAKWETFVFDWLPTHGLPDGVGWHDFPTVLHAWSAWAARTSHVPQRARAELASTLAETLVTAAGDDPPLPII